MPDKEIRFEVGGEIRHDSEAHREGCSCRTRTDHAFDRDATIADLVARGHTHVNWADQSDTYVQTYAAEMAHIREQRDAIATVPRNVHEDDVPLPVTPKPLAPLFNTIEARAARRNAAARKRS